VPIEEIGVKAVAARLRLSPALIYKWCQEHDSADPEASGARNPLDRLADIVRETNNRDVVNWLCHEAGGFFVSNPQEPKGCISTELLVHTQQLVGEFSLLLSTVTGSIEDDGEIVAAEADKIRAAWEALKQSAEQFTTACERGAYRSAKN